MKKVIYTKELLENLSKDCYSFAELCHRLGLKPEGSNPKTVRKKMDEFQVDYSHFTGKGWNKLGHPNFANGVSLISSLCINSSLSSAHAKKRLFSHGLKENRCEICGITEWQEKPIECELHHINGDPTDNRLENLQILCPNCHSQTDNFRNRKVLSAPTETLDVERS